MNNPNTLVALAYIKINDNPMQVFCNYILALLITAPGKTLRNDELIQKLEEKFGLCMTQTMINNCISIMRKSGEVERLQKGAGYSVKQTDFDVDEFEANMCRLHIQEDAVIKALVQFVKEKYNLSWDYDKAKGYLSSFLNERGNAARLFMNDNIESGDSRLGDSWYVGRFVDFLLGSDKVEKQYLKDINNGLMIYQGVYQTKDYQQDRGQKFHNTVFYFDTKMVLRLTGYSIDMHVKATRELAEMIRVDYGGKIGIFERTVTEVRNALYSAGKAYESGNPIWDLELAVFAKTHKNDAGGMLEAACCLDNLLKKYGLVREEDIDWESDYYHQYWLNTDEIAQQLLAQFNWREASVINDVAVINQINILRRGYYDERFGGKRKLPVFVTTNTGLVYGFKQYIEEKIANRESTGLNPHALPVISEGMLLARLWVPFAVKYSDLPTLTLARQAYAAQNPETGFFEKLRSVAAEYSKTANVDVFNLSDLYKQKFEDLLIAKTEGEVAALTVDMVASSVDELVQMENLSLRQEVETVQQELAASREEGTRKDTLLGEKDQTIIHLLASQYANKLGWRRLLILAADHWWILATLVCQVVAHFICAGLDGEKWPHLVGLLPVGLEAVLSILDKCCEKRGWHKWLLYRAVAMVWRWYYGKVMLELQQEKEFYRNHVVAKCIEDTPVFAEHKELCKL